MKKFLLILLAAALTLSLASCSGKEPQDEDAPGGASEPAQQTQQIQQAQESAAPVQEETPASESGTFTVGDAVSVNDIVVTLVDVSESTGGNYMKPDDGKVFILCEFNIENNSDKDLPISSIMSFKAYIDDYSATLNISAILSSNKSQLDGAIAAGKKMNGVIGYEADESWETIEITFTPDVFFGDGATFVYSK